MDRLLIAREFGARFGHDMIRPVYRLAGRGLDGNTQRAFGLISG